MSRLKRFYAKPKEYTIKGEKVQVSPLTGKNVDLLLSFNTEDDVEGMKSLLYHYIELLYGEKPTDEDFEEFGMDFITELMQAIVEVNGLKQVKKR